MIKSNVAIKTSGGFGVMGIVEEPRLFVACLDFPGFKVQFPAAELMT